MADAGGVSDDTLMTLAVAGDVAAFSALMRRHEQAIMRYLTRALADPEDARDVCQDVFIEAWRRRQSYEPRGLLLAWLFRIARSRAISRGRFTPCDACSRPVAMPRSTTKAAPGPTTSTNNASRRPGCAAPC